MIDICPVPESLSESVVEVIHGIPVEDPFRWLEDQDSTQTRRWLAGQNVNARAYFGSLSCRKIVRERIAELLSVETYDSPIEIAGRVFFLKRTARQEQPCICVRNSTDSEDVLLVDPSLRSEADAAVRILAISCNARLVAYGVRHGGEDTQSVEIFDVESRRILADRLPRGTLRGFAFMPDSSFYYSYAALDADPADGFRVRRHVLGTSPADDQTVLHLAADPTIKGVSVLASGGPQMAFLVSRLAGAERLLDLYLFHPGLDRSPRLSIEGIQGNFGPRFAGERLFALTTVGAINSRIVEICLASPEPDRWREIVAESPRRIKNFAIVGDRIHVVYVAEDHTPLQIYDLNGRRLPAPHLPTGTIANVWSYAASEAAFFEFTSFTCPRTLYRVDSNGTALWRQRAVPFDPAGIEVQRTWFQSKDGTRVPMFLVGKELDSVEPRPTVLSAYGGFGTSLTPQFTAYGTFLIEQGALLAIANIRGGSEFGGAWHNAAKREKRQNAFDDFLAAAQHLIDSGHTTPAQLGIVGGSNAGLLVGAAITQRPDMFRAALCLGPLLDMLRYHKFGRARFWADEYGCADDPAGFEYLYAYSPYHRVRDGERYPAILLISGDRDERCDPLHARKMTARLQRATASGHPILLDYQASRGHAPALPLQVRIDSLTDRIAFLCDQLGIHVQPTQQVEA